MQNIEQIAQICHETNRAYCQTIGDDSQQSWDRAEEWQRESARRGVRFAIENPGAPASAQHDAWLQDKIRDGWKYGPFKIVAKREHPCILPYAELPVQQRFKDDLFRAIVMAFLNLER